VAIEAPPTQQDDDGGEARPGPSRAPLIRIAIGIVVVAAIALLFLLPSQRAMGDLPRFELQKLDGSGSISDADLRGHPVVINFWASWCGPCRREAPLLERKWGEYESKGVRFVGVDVKDLEDPAAEFASKFGLTYPLVRDPDLSLYKDLTTDDGLPQTFFIAPDGSVMAGGRGEVEDADLTKHLDELVEAAGTS
jgi:cytochrome c biogenesis protein CcmG/thiol:disulfide interchange protein DsbE